MWPASSASSSSALLILNEEAVVVDVNDDVDDEVMSLGGSEKREDVDKLSIFLEQAIITP